MGLPAISDEEKRLALTRVLESRTFGRSDQLRAFLRYVCEAERDGRAQQLNEYALGVSVLGRPEGYSPAEDSSVRSRAYELRNKLKSYYQTEAPDEPIRIEIEKGAYVPRFHRHAAADAPPVAVPPARSGPVKSTATEGAGSTVPRRTFMPRAVTSVVLVVALLAFGWWASRRKAPQTGLAARASTHEMEALWKPFLDPTTPLLLSFEIRLFLYAPATGLVVRDFQTNQKDEIAGSKPLTAFRERMGADQLIETHDYADVGAVQAAFLLGRTLDREVSLKYASALGWEDIWNSNV